MSTADDDFHAALGYESPRKTWEWALRWRGVLTPCAKCNGSGVYVYGSTATWQGGIGGAAMTPDVCDKCWGTGDDFRIGADLRKLIAERQAWDEEQALSYLAQRLGASFRTVRPKLRALAALCRKESRRRKIPEEESAHWWETGWNSLADVLQTLGTEPDS